MTVTLPRRSFASSPRAGIGRTWHLVKAALSGGRRLRGSDVWLTVVLVLALAACRGDGTAPSFPNVDGSWTFNIPDLAGPAVTCSFLGVTLLVEQVADTFTGTYSNGRVTCVSPTDTILDQIGRVGPIVDGLVTELGSVQFDLDTSDLRHTGTIAGDTMSGTATWSIDFGGTVGRVISSGEWSATR